AVKPLVAQPCACWLWERTAALVAAIERRQQSFVLERTHRECDQHRAGGYSRRQRIGGRGEEMKEPRGRGARPAIGVLRLLPGRRTRERLRQLSQETRGVEQRERLSQPRPRVLRPLLQQPQHLARPRIDDD